MEKPPPPPGAGSPSVPERIYATVTVDTDELRRWAAHHADRGHHGVAHVLYKAAAEGESLTEQALDAARREGATIGRRAQNDPGRYVPRGADDDGEPYGESLHRWQARALDTALEQAGLANANGGERSEDAGLRDHRIFLEVIRRIGQADDVEGLAAAVRQALTPGGGS